MSATGSTSRLLSLERQQRQAFEPSGKKPLRTPGDAERFLARVRIALRYQATKGLPLPSVRAACGPPDHHDALVMSIGLTNHLLGTACGLEVNVVAKRLTLVHRSLMPALYRLVRRGRFVTDLTALSLDARAAVALITEQREVTVGDVRRRLGRPAGARSDPGYEALAELQAVLLVDRGPFVMPETGIPYLSPNGYPYHFVHDAHADLIRASARLSVDTAAETWLEGYLRAAVFASSRRLAGLFRSFLSPSEIAAAVERLSVRGVVKVETVGRASLVIARTPA